MLMMQSNFSEIEHSRIKLAFNFLLWSRLLKSLVYLTVRELFNKYQKNNNNKGDLQGANENPKKTRVVGVRGVGNMGLSCRCLPD